MNKTQLQNIAANPLASDIQRTKAQNILDQMKTLDELEQTPEVVAAKDEDEVKATPAASTSTSTRGARGSMWWIPEPTPAEQIAYRALAAAVRAGIDERLKDSGRN